MSDPIEQKVISMLAEMKQVQPATINLNSSFQDLGVDSLDALHLIGELENEFGIVVPDEDAMGIINVGQMVESLKRLLADKSGPVSA